MNELQFAKNLIFRDFESCRAEVHRLLDESEVYNLASLISSVHDSLNALLGDLSGEIALDKRNKKK